MKNIIICIIIYWTAIIYYVVDILYNSVRIGIRHKFYRKYNKVNYNNTKKKIKKLHDYFYTIIWVYIYIRATL